MNRGIRVLQTHALPLGYVTILKKRRLLHSKISVLSHVGAEDEARTRYLHLGKVALYQMSYSRIFNFFRCPFSTCLLYRMQSVLSRVFCKKQGRGLLKKRNRPLSFLQVV